MTRHYILATAGHVDHGKSALVKALTGTDPDRLPEEKARGITIDLGFAHLELPAPLPAGDPPSPVPPEPSTFSVGLVDVPGHEDFVRNMVAGVGSIDLALFVVAADDGWMPQTEEHLQILTYLGVTRAVVALTKIDLTRGGENEAIAALRERLQESPFAAAPVVATSVVTGEGLDELKSVLARTLAEAPLPPDAVKPRLPVDRVFTLRGIGTVVTGTLIGGGLRRGQPVVLQPGGQGTRVRSLQTHNREVGECSPGMRTAVNLADIDPRSGANLSGVARGDVLTLAELGGACEVVDVEIEKSARLAGSPLPAARPLKDGTLVRVHYGSAESPARVRLRDGVALVARQRALAELRFTTPVFVFAGDRFIVRDWSEQTTLAGGTVLEPDANRRRWATASQDRFLAQRAARPNDPTAFVASLLLRDGGVLRSALLLKSRFAAIELGAAVDQLVARQQAVTAGDLVLDAAWWQTLQRTGAEAIDAEHRTHPERPGLALSELRTTLADALNVPGVFDLLVAQLGRSGFRAVGTAIRREAHRPALPTPLQAAGAKSRAALVAKPFDPPSRKDLAPDAVAQQALRFLLNTGEAIEISAEVVMSAQAYGQIVERIQAHLRVRGQATVSELRQAIGSSRRVMVPLLEKLDREGVTRRQGDVRLLGRAEPMPPANGAPV